MDNYTATMIAQGEFELAGIEEVELTEKMYLEAWQHLVNTGLAWELEGWFGRIANYLIKKGVLNGSNK